MYESGCSQEPTTAYTDHSCKEQRCHVNITFTKTRVKQFNLCSSDRTNWQPKGQRSGRALVPGGCGQHFGVGAEVAEADRTRITDLTAEVVEILGGKGKIYC